MQNDGTFGVIFTQNRSFEAVRNVKIGDIVWIPLGHKDEEGVVGPLLVVHARVLGYGCNARTVWKCLDTEKNEYHEMEQQHLYRPGEF